PPRGGLGLPVTEMGREEKARAAAQGFERRLRPGMQARRTQRARGEQRDQGARKVETEPKPEKKRPRETGQVEITTDDARARARNREEGGEARGRDIAGKC